MPAIDVVVESGIDLSVRARQVCGMFDCPPEKKQQLEWKADLPIEDEPWNIGLIVGPSGCGKSTVARHLWPDEMKCVQQWDGKTVIDCFASPVEETAKALNAVGFSTVPAWLRPFQVLSNGEQFRADMARRIVEQDGLIVVDEFTSVVDRQVAQVASYAIQKYIRRQSKQMVAVSCHDDIIEWLQPDWIFRPATCEFERRSVQPRPRIDIEVARLPYEAWQLFAPYHYLTAELNPAARCYGLWVNGNLAAFGGVLHRPHPVTKNIKGLSRLVTLPDYQGLGLGFVLSETIGAAYTGLGFRYRNYPAHPGFVRSYRKENWTMVKRAGKIDNKPMTQKIKGYAKLRPCAVMEYIGPKMDAEQAAKLVAGEK